MVRGDLCSAQVEGTESIGEIRQQSRHIGLFQKTEAGRVRQQIQIHERLIDRWVGGEEVDQGARAKARASGQAQVRDTRSLGDGEES